MKDIHISSIFLPSIITVALNHGIDTHSFLEDHDVSFDLTSIQQTNINLKKLHSIVIEIERLTGIPSIGLEIGEEFSFDYLPLANTYLKTASTFREVVQIAYHLRQLVSQVVVFELIEQNQTIKVVLRTIMELEEVDEQHLAEMVLSCLKNMVGNLLRETIYPESVHFRHQNHDLVPVYQAYFNCPIILGEPESAITYKRDLFDRPLSGGLPEIHQQAKELMEQQIHQSNLKNRLTLQITNILIKDSELLRGSIDQLGHSLGMSARTLQRRLDDEGTSYNELKDQVRLKIASQHLRSGSMSIEEISDELGFSDRHSFTHAFKRWAGTSPSAYRKKYHPQ